MKKDYLFNFLIYSSMSISTFFVRDSLQATPLNVTMNSDTTPVGMPGELRYAMNQMLAAQAQSPALNSWQVNFSNAVTTITLSQPLPMINLFNADMVTFVPTTPITINGNGNRGFFVRQGTVSFQDMTIENCVAQGGAGGNGGYGGGGGMGLAEHFLSIKPQSRYKM